MLTAHTMSQTPRPSQTQRSVLRAIAERAMRERGLLPSFSPAVNAEVSVLVTAPLEADTAGREDSGIRDLTGLLWASIDNDDSRDLDQLTAAEAGPGDVVVIRVAIADVDALVPLRSATDDHARQNTTSVYTVAEVFPMLPERLSTDLTSLNQGEDRLAVIIEMAVAGDGAIRSSDVYRARVRNRAKLAYHSVAAWLTDGGAIPMAISAVPELAENLRLQDRVAGQLRQLRRLNGALSFETVRARPVFDGDEIQRLDVEQRDRAAEIIEDFMIAANGVTARYLASKHLPSIRRVVRTPARWSRIVELAATHGVTLPGTADSGALEAFLIKARADDPTRFGDLSLSVIKLLGAGEYVAERPGATAPGHFGLAVKDYAHSTAPNRRYPDLVTQRLLKAAIAGTPSPYAFDTLEALAIHCTTQEDAANKVERQVAKSAAAMLLASRIGEAFSALVTGASAKGTWVRLLDLPVEGRVVRHFDGMDVGESVQVRLISVDVERGFIDFQGLIQAGAPPPALSDRYRPT